MSDAIETEGEAAGFVYHFRPRMIGGGHAFRLSEHSLEFDLAGHRGQVAYPMIARVRIGYRPSSVGGRRFVAEIWPRNASRIDIASASYRSVVSMEDQGPAFNAFIGELHRRIADAGADCRFEAGVAAWRWWPMLAIGIATAGALLYVLIQALASADFAAAALVAGFIAVFAWQMAPIILRNRPRVYDPRRIPPDVMP